MTTSLLVALLSGVISICSLILAFVAITLSMRSNRIIASLGNLEYDEKLAVMSGHVRNVRDDDDVALIRKIKHDFMAVSNLKRYASSQKKEDLIHECVIPIVRAAIENNRVSGSYAFCLKDMLETALDYGVDTSVIKELLDKLKAS